MKKTLIALSALALVMALPVVAQPDPACTLRPDVDTTYATFACEDVAILAGDVTLTLPTDLSFEEGSAARYELTVRTSTGVDLVGYVVDEVGVERSCTRLAPGVYVFATLEADRAGFFWPVDWAQTGGPTLADCI